MKELALFELNLYATISNFYPSGNAVSAIRLAVISLLALTLTGCAVVAVADAVGTVVGTTVEVTADVVGAAVDVVIPD